LTHELRQRGNSFNVRCHVLQIAAAYGCQMVEGVLSHQMKQFVIDANKCVLHRPSTEARVEDGEFEENEVYAIDIVVSTGEGKTRARGSFHRTQEGFPCAIVTHVRGERSVCHPHCVVDPGGQHGGAKFAVLMPHAFLATSLGRILLLEPYSELQVHI
jgi:hypothetical protein